MQYYYKIINSKLFFIIFASLIIFIALYFKYPTNTHIQDMLWAEDGTVFLSQAYEYGVSSILIPYAGYLHLYPRIFALMVKALGLWTAPYVFFCAWLLACYLMVYIIINTFYNIKFNKYYALLITCLIILQPHTGEIFFNLTNSQWLLGLALIVMVCLTELDYKYNLLTALFLMLVGLTGPFVIFLLPTIALKTLLLKQSRTTLSMYFIIFVCAIIQITFIIYSDRLDPNTEIIPSNPIHITIYYWLINIFKFLNFGSKKVGIIITASIFWMVFTYNCFYIFINKWAENKKYCYNLFSLLVIALLVYLSVLIMFKYNPSILSPVGSGARYFFIPYGLLIIAVFYSFYANKKQLFFLILIFSTISILQFKTFAKPSLNFDAYVAFSKYKLTFKIPLHPQDSPKWNLIIKNEIQSDAAVIKTISLDTLIQFNGQTLDTNHEIKIRDPNEDPYIIIDKFTSCGTAKYLGLDISIFKNNDGVTQLFWSHNTTFSESNSITRYYPKGDNVMEFAFPYFDDGVYIRFDPSNTTDVSTIKSITIYCL